MFKSTFEWRRYGGFCEEWEDTQ